MADAHRQPTLSPSSSALVACAEQLTLTQISAWYALELSTDESAKLTPARNLTEDLFASLESSGIIKRAKPQDPHSRTALYDSLSWVYGSSPLVTSVDRKALCGLLRTRARDVEPEEIAQFWSMLASAESESYLRNQMMRHRLDFENFEEVICLAQELWIKHSLGRRRYLAWHAVRHAAASMMRSGSNLRFAADVLLTSINRRARWLHQRANSKTQANEYCFVPEASWRSPILVDVFLKDISNIGHRYWSSPPRADNILPRK